MSDVFDSPGYSQTNADTVYSVGFRVSVENIEETDPLRRLPQALGKALRETFEASQRQVFLRAFKQEEGK